MVIGDVNVDSIVSASGDVAVFGRLSGEVHAGNNGDSSATVSAICFEPSQIRIADVVAVMGGPTSSEPTPYPEVARVEWPRSTPKQRLSREPGRDQQQGRIMVEPAGQFWQQLSARGRKRRAARLMAEGKLKWSPPAKSARLTGLYLLVAGIRPVKDPLLALNAMPLINQHCPGDAPSSVAQHHWLCCSGSASGDWASP